MNDKPTFEMDHKGNHRILFGNEVGEPALYESPSLLKTKDGRVFIAVTQYYGFEGFDSERVYEIKPIDSESQMSPICNFFRPDKKCSC